MENHGKSQETYWKPLGVPPFQEISKWSIIQFGENHGFPAFTFTGTPSSRNSLSSQIVKIVNIHYFYLMAYNGVVRCKAVYIYIDNNLSVQSSFVPGGFCPGSKRHCSIWRQELDSSLPRKLKSWKICIYTYNVHILYRKPPTQKLAVSA